MSYHDVSKAFCLNGGDQYPQIVRTGVIAQQLTVKNHTGVPKLERTQTKSFRNIKISQRYADLKIHDPPNWYVSLVVLSQSLSPDRRSLSHNSRPLSHRSIKHRKHTTRVVRNIKNFQNRPNSRKVMMI